MAGSLKKGNTVQAYLYKYDIDNDSTRYEYSESVAIAERNPVAKESAIEIVTDSIRADRTDVWIMADFADDLTGTVKLYTYEGGSFDAEQAEEIYSGTVKASEDSQKVSFGSGKLTAGKIWQQYYIYQTIPLWYPRRKSFRQCRKRKHRLYSLLLPK